MNIPVFPHQDIVLRSGVSLNTSWHTRNVITLTDSIGREQWASSGSPVPGLVAEFLVNMGIFT